MKKSLLRKPGAPMSTRLNSLLCFMLLVLSLTVLGPYILRNRDDFAAFTKAASEDLTLFSRQCFGVDTGGDAAPAAEPVMAVISRDGAKLRQFAEATVSHVEAAMADDARAISAMLMTRVDLVQEKALASVASDKKTAEHNLSLVVEAFPTATADLRQMLEYSTNVAALLGVFTAQPQLAAEADEDQTVVAEAKSGDDPAEATAKSARPAVHRAAKPATVAEAPTAGGKSFDIDKIFAAPGRLIKSRLHSMLRTAQANG